MDIQTYSEIIRKRGQDPHEAFKSGWDRVTHSLRADLLSNKIIWTDDSCSDWFDFVKCHHVLLSIVLAPRVHPFGRGERCVVYLCMISLSVLWASIAAAIKEQDAVYQYTVSIGGGIFNILCNSMLRAFATCGCAQDCPFCIRVIFEFIGRGLLFGASICCLFIFVIGIVLSLDTISDFMLSFVVSLAVGWAFALIPNTIFFIYHRKKERKKCEFQENKFVISFHDYNQHKQELPLTRRLSETEGPLDSAIIGLQNKAKEIELATKQKAEQIQTGIMKKANDSLSGKRIKAEQMHQKAKDRASAMMSTFNKKRGNSTEIINSVSNHRIGNPDDTPSDDDREHEEIDKTEEKKEDDADEECEENESHKNHGHSDKKKAGRILTGIMDIRTSLLSNKQIKVEQMRKASAMMSVFNKKHDPSDTHTSH